MMLGSPCSACCGPTCTELLSSFPPQLAGSISLIETGPCAPGTSNLTFYNSLIQPQGISLNMERLAPTSGNVNYLEVATPTFSGSGNTDFGDFVTVSFGCQSPSLSPTFNIQAVLKGYQFGTTFPGGGQRLISGRWVTITAWSQLYGSGSIRVFTLANQSTPNCVGVFGQFSFAGLNPLP